jgi:cytochrome b pre-mRNA-processing protein 3
MWPFVRRNRLAPVERLYDSIAAQARQPLLFADYGVADTFEGRFELMALHLALVLRRLAELPAPADDVAQELTDLSFKRLDQGLREIGVGDMGVPKRMKVLAKAFYGRAGVYHAVIGASDDAKLVQAKLVQAKLVEAKLIEALRRNVFADGEGDVEALSRRVQALVAHLSTLDLETMLAQGVDGAGTVETAQGGP